MDWNIEILLKNQLGKVVHKHTCHNVWVNNGREYLAELLSYSSFTPLTTIEDRRVLYIGFGIGGAGQSQPAVANNPPMSTDYPGTNLQKDIDLSITTLERPVRIQAGIYLQQFAVPVFDDAYTLRLTASFATTDISYGAYLVVPISEVGLFLSDATISAPGNEVVAYDTFDTVSKTQAFAMDVNWLIRF